jgi:hypothetical protein
MISSFSVLCFSNKITGIINFFLSFPSKKQMKDQIKSNIKLHKVIINVNDGDLERNGRNHTTQQLVGKGLHRIEFKPGSAGGGRALGSSL